GMTLDRSWARRCIKTPATFAPFWRPRSRAMSAARVSRISRPTEARNPRGPFRRPENIRAGPVGPVHNRLDNLEHRERRDGVADKSAEYAPAFQLREPAIQIRPFRRHSRPWG